MSNRAKAVVLVLSLSVVVFAVAGGLGVRASTNNDGPYRQLGVLSEVLSRIRSEYVEEPNIPNVTDGALHGLLESLDANSSYLDSAEFKKYESHKASGKADIGATVSKRFGYAAIVSAVPGGPADKVGIDSGDIVESIENKSTRDMSLAEIDSELSGPPGSTVEVSVVRARRAEPTKVTITREVTRIPDVAYKMMDQDIGYLKVDGLDAGKSQELANGIKTLQKQGAKKLILDLRDCSDGAEGEGIAAANLFLNHGTISYIQGQKYPRQTFNADPEKAVTNLPVVVMVNGGTAGPAEIVAAAVLENARGDVLGDKTFGMGSVQKLLDLPGGGALILSVAKYYTPTGKAIQDTAITPNILVADSTDAVLPDEDLDSTKGAPLKHRELGNDEQLHRALEVLKNNPQKAANQ